MALPRRIVMITEDHAAVSGGVPTVVDQLSRRLAASGVPVDVICVRDDPQPPGPGVRLELLHPAAFAGTWGYSASLVDRLSELAEPSTGTVFHLHGVWTAPQWFGARIAARRRVPFVLSAHAMLQPWFWYGRGWGKRLKKKLYWSVAAAPVFRRAGILHAITSLERDVLAELLPGQRIAVIPNAVDLVPIDLAIHQRAEAEPLPVVLFLGRIDPQKGVDMLIRAFDAARLSRDWRLVIAGPPGPTDYVDAVRQLARDARRADQIEFLGPIFGGTKWDWLRKSWVVAVPSHTEVIGMVNLEAAACRVPTITTCATGLADWEEGGGVLIDADASRLQRALETACSWTDHERKSRGESIRRLVERNYSWEAVLPRWLGLYGALMNG